MKSYELRSGKAEMSYKCMSKNFFISLPLPLSRCLDCQSPRSSQNADVAYCTFLCLGSNVNRE